MQLLLLSDIHGNVSALKSVLMDVKKRFSPDYAVILGDNIDYGMRSNQILDIISKLETPIIANLWGNHEYAIIREDYEHFSSKRGIESAKYTRRHLSEESKKYLNSFNGQSGFFSFIIENKNYLAIHGSLDSPFWGNISPDSNLSNIDYSKYDYVISGHNHKSHYFPIFYKNDDSEYRNKKVTYFINPGSVGQPRNHICKAQYAVFDTDSGISFNTVDYDIKYEQSLFNEEIDSFYSLRLSKGI